MFEIIAGLAAAIGLLVWRLLHVSKQKDSFREAANDAARKVEDLARERDRSEKAITRRDTDARDIEEHHDDLRHQLDANHAPGPADIGRLLKRPKD